MRCLGLTAALLTCSVAFAGNNLRNIDVFAEGLGMIPQVVDSNEWKTTLYFTNFEATTSYIAVIFADDTGKPMTLSTTVGSGDTWTASLPGHSTVSIETAGTGALKQGYAVFMTCDRACGESSSRIIRSRVAGSAVFRLRVPGRSDSEAVVPVESGQKQARIIFDNRAGYATGIALLNFLEGNVSVQIRDHQGNIVGSEMLALTKGEKTVFVLAEKYRVTAGMYGTIEFSGNAIAVLGLRFTPGGAFTSSHAMSMN